MQKRPIILLLILILMILLLFTLIIINLVFPAKEETQTSKSLEDTNSVIENVIEYSDVENKLTKEASAPLPKQVLPPTDITSDEPYFIMVNLEQQVVNIFEKDDNGYYTNAIKAMICSTGTHTPKSGTYNLTGFRKEWLDLQGDVYGQYASQITGNILFHSVPYFEKNNPASLEYLEYDKLGTEASLGCIRLKVVDAKWIYDNCLAGTKVHFYYNNIPGPLGKPSADKISQAQENLRNWDPTDSSKKNPWNSLAQ